MRMAKTIPVRQFRANLAEVLSDVADRREHVVVTRYGRCRASSRAAVSLAPPWTLASVRRTA